MSRIRALAVAGLVGVGVLAGACDPGGTSPTGSPPVSASPAPATATASTVEPVGSAPVGRTPECKKAAGLTVALGATDAGSTHRSVRLVFTNTSGTTCRLVGYPGVAALNVAGTQVAQAQRTLSGYLGGPGKVASVDVAPGTSASAVVEGLAIDAATGNPCAAYPALLVTAPDDTQSTKLTWGGDLCSDLQVHPVAAGSG